MLFARMPLGFGHAHPLEAGFLEHGVDVPHLGQGFNPRPRGRFASSPNKRRRQARSAIHRMQHHAGERHQLAVQGFDGRTIPSPGFFEEPVALPKRNRGRSQNANSDGFFAVPKQRDVFHESQVVGSIMPPSEIRPIAARTGGDVDVVCKADGALARDFFFEPSSSWRVHSMFPSNRQLI